ncbi:MAG: Ig-like domain-containing protein [Gemmatimonadaceae bacterium]
MSSPHHQLTETISVGTSHDATRALQTVYVSLPPASYPEAVSAKLQVVGTTITVSTAVVNGGFDPVGIAALVGDEIEITTLDVSGKTTGRRVTVPPSGPPVIVRAEPPPYKRDVPLNTNLIIVFSEPIDAASLSNSSIQLNSGTALVDGLISFADVAHTQVQFIPASPLLSATDYVLTANVLVRNLNGTSLASTVSVSFTTVSVPRLTLIRAAPFETQTNVDVLSPVLELWFNEPVRIQSLADSNNQARIQLRLDGVTINADEAQFACRSVGIPTVGGCTSIFIVTNAPLRTGSNYQLVALAGLEGISGAILPDTHTIQFTTESPPTGESNAVLSAVSFTMLEFQVPSQPGWWQYAPKLVLAESSGKGPATIVSLSFFLPGFYRPFPLICGAGLRILAQSSVDLFGEHYGDFDRSFDFDGPGTRAAAGDATLVVTYRDDAGRMSAITVQGHIVPGALPTTYTGGNGYPFYVGHSGC